MAGGGGFGPGLPRGWVSGVLGLLQGEGVNDRSRAFGAVMRDGARKHPATGTSELFETTMLAQKDGVCNSMPGWDPLNIWNPKSYQMDPDCRLHPMYQQRGMGAGASYGGQY
ncbi:hypothetical protein T484DRAFT_1899139 [Baffinella frigidus]|nr:hypothetical protein T484DRAFT_1899139 [Cryptophyta sp. CCMP2293]